MKLVKQRILGTFLAMVMLISLLPTTVLATSSTLPDPIDGVITLTENVVLTSTLEISNAVVIEGNGFTITATGLNPAFAINTNEQVTLNKLTLEGATRGIYLNSNAPHLTLTDCIFNVSDRGISCMQDGAADGANIVLDNTKINNSQVSDYTTEAVYNNHRGISLWDTKNSTVTLQNGSEINGFSYCINVSGEPSDSGVADTNNLVVTIQDSTLRGWSGLNIWGSQATYNIIRSTVLGVNTNSGSSNSFSAIVFNDDIYDQFANLHSVNNILNIEDSTIKNYQNGQCVEQLLRIDCGITQLNLRGTVNFTDTTGNISYALYLGNMADRITFLKNNVNKDGATVNCTSTVAGKTLKFAPVLNTLYYWDTDTPGQYEGCYADLNDIFAGNGYTLYAGEYMDLIDHVVLSGDTTATVAEGAGAFTLNFGEYAITGGKILLPAGVSIICDQAADAVIAPADGCLLSKVVESDTVTYTSVNAENVVAQVGSAFYTSLVDAVAAAGANDTVILLNDVQNIGSYIRIEDGKKVTLDLNNHNIGFSAGKYFFVCNGTLTLTGTGKIFEQTPYFGPVVMKGSTEDQANYSVVNVGKNVTLDGWAGLFMDSRKVATVYYGYGMVANIEGTLIGRNDGSDDGFALYLNGNVKHTEGNVPEIHIAGTAKLTGDSAAWGIYQAGYANTTIENGASIEGTSTGIEIRAGKLTVNGGTITGKGIPTDITPNGNGTTSSGCGIAISQHTTKLPIEVTINDGTISGYSALYQSNSEKNGDEAIAKVTMNVKGGNFNNINGGTVSVYSENKTDFISGGYFTSDPTAYVVEGKAVVTSDKPGYAYMIGEPAEDEIIDKPAIKPSVVDDTAFTGSEEQKEAAVNAANTVCADEAITEAARTAGVSDDAKEAAVEQVKAELNNPTEEIIIYRQTYLDVTPIEYETTEATQTLIMDITPMLQIIASTAQTADDIVLDEVDGKNAVAINDPQALTINTASEITVQLPDAFKGQTVYIEHIKGAQTYFYQGTADSDGNLTFTSLHGFSPFTFMTTNPAVAQITTTDGTTVGYPSLQAAIDDAPDGATIQLLQADNAGATVCREITFTLDQGDYPVGPIQAGFAYILTVEGNTYTCTRNPVISEGTDETVPPVTNPFTDVTPADYYYNAVLWAVENGITYGTSDTTFSPDDVCTRGEMMTFLYRYFAD